MKADRSVPNSWRDCLCGYLLAIHACVRQRAQYRHICSEDARAGCEYCSGHLKRENVFFID
jgi:hypothetical protein